MSIAELLARRGDIVAQGARESGRIYGQLAQQLGQVPGQIYGQVQADRRLKTEEADAAQARTLRQQQIDANTAGVASRTAAGEEAAIVARAMAAFVTPDGKFDEPKLIDTIRTNAPAQLPTVLDMLAKANEARTKLETAKQSLATAQLSDAEKAQKFREAQIDYLGGRAAFIKSLNYDPTTLAIELARLTGEGHDVSSVTNAIRGGKTVREVIDATIAASEKQRTLGNIETDNARADKIAAETARHNQAMEDRPATREFTFRDYLPAYSAQFHRGKPVAALTATEIEDARKRFNQSDDRNATGGLSNELPSEYKTAAARAMLAVPANRRILLSETVNRLWSEGKTYELKDVIRQAAIESENVDTKNQVLGRVATVASLKDTDAILTEMKAKGVPTGFFVGTAENLVRKLGETTNPEYVELANRLQGTLINYRRAATGVAFGAKEGADYERMFPNYKNELPVNQALIRGLLREMSTYDRAYWEHKLGPEGAKLVGVGGDIKVPGAGAYTGEVRQRADGALIGMVGGQVVLVEKQPDGSYTVKK